MPTAATAITIGTVQVWDEEIEETFSRTQSVIVRQMKCAWSDRVLLTSYLRGSANIIGGVTIITTPQAAPGYPFMYVETVNNRGEGAKSQGPNSEIAYQRAIVTVTYSPLSSTTTGSIGLDFGQIVYSMPANSLKFGDGAGEPVPGGKPRVTPIVGISQARLGLGALPIATILGVAAAPIDSSGLFGSGGGTLMFDGGRAFRNFTTGGAENWSVEYRWKYNPIGWSKMYDSTGVLRTVIPSAGGTLYNTSNHSTLLS